MAGGSMPLLSNRENNWSRLFEGEITRQPAVDAMTARKTTPVKAGGSGKPLKII